MVVALAAAKIGMHVPLERPRLTPEMQRLAALAAPGVIAGGMAQFTMVISTIIATLQDRVVSWLYYAERIFQLPLGVIGVAIGVVLLPDLSHKLRSGDHAAVLECENRALEFALLLTMPAAIALAASSGGSGDPVVRCTSSRYARASPIQPRVSRMWYLVCVSKSFFHASMSTMLSAPTAARAMP